MTADPRSVEYFTADRVDDFDRRTAILARLVADRDDWPRLTIIGPDQNDSYGVAVVIDNGYDRNGALQMLEHYVRHASRLADEANSQPTGEGDRKPE